MTNIDKELIEWVIDTIQTKYPEDVSLLIGQIGGCKIPTDEQNLAFDYFVPATERGFQLSETFIIEDMGYDLYPMTFDRLEKIADLEEPRMVWVIEKSEIIYCRTEQDRDRFTKIKERLRLNLKNKEKTLSKALEFIEIAMEIYNTMQFEDNLCKVRKAAGGVSSMLTYSLAMLNGSALADGYGNLGHEVKKMERKPNEFQEIYLQMIASKTVGDIRSTCRMLIRSVRDLFQIIKMEQKRTDEERGTINYEDLAFWYQEARYTFRKIAYYISQNDSPLCFSLGCYLQIEFDAIQDEFGLDEMNLMGAFDANDLSNFLTQVEKLENYLVEVIKSNHVVLNHYKSIEDFLIKHR